MPAQKKKFHVAQKKFNVGIFAAGKKIREFLYTNNLVAIWL
jgi:hypothetical protein